MQRQATPKFFSAAGKHTRKKRARLKNFCINTDHLGNTRVSFKDSDGNGSIAPENEVIEANDFYPFGLTFDRPNTVIGSTNLGQKFKYNGVELNEDLGLYEMSFRQYDPAIARFTSIDPVTHYSMSTYTAFDNNPVFWSDPSGANATKFVMDLFNRSGDDETWTNNDDGTFSSDKGQEADCDECPDESSIGEFGLSAERDFELFKSFTGCQQDDCYDPIDFKKDSPEKIYQKLVNNVATFIKARNRALQNGDITFAVYLEEMIRLDNIYNKFDKSAGEIINRNINYNGGTIEIVGLPILDQRDPMVGYRIKGAVKRQHGVQQYYTYEIHLLGASRNKVEGRESTRFRPKTLNIRFSSKEQYNSFMKEINKSLNY